MWGVYEYMDWPWHKAKSSDLFYIRLKQAGRQADRERLEGHHPMAMRSWEIIKLTIPKAAKGPTFWIQETVKTSYGSQNRDREGWTLPLCPPHSLLREVLAGTKARNGRSKKTINCSQLNPLATTLATHSYLGRKLHMWQFEKTQ